MVSENVSAEQSLEPSSPTQWKSSYWIVFFFWFLCFLPPTVV